MLPDSLLATVFAFFGIRERAILGYVCTGWRRIRALSHSEVIHFWGREPNWRTVFALSNLHAMTHLRLAFLTEYIDHISNVDLSSLRQLRTLSLDLETSSCGLEILRGAARTLPPSVQMVRLQLFNRVAVALPTEWEALGLYDKVTELDVHTSGVMNLVEVWPSMQRLERLGVHGYMAGCNFSRDMAAGLLAVHPTVTKFSCKFVRFDLLDLRLEDVARLCPNVDTLVLMSNGLPGHLPLGWKLRHFAGECFVRERDWSDLVSLTLTDVQLPATDPWSLPSLESLALTIQSEFRPGRLPVCPRLHTLSLWTTGCVRHFALSKFSTDDFTVAYPGVRHLNLYHVHEDEHPQSILPVSTLCAWNLVTCLLGGLILLHDAWPVWCLHARDTLTYLRYPDQHIRTLLPHTLVE